MKALGIVFSNIHDKEIAELTAHRTLASVPFGGRYRLIDFVLSNMINSGITKVGIITKENYQSLMDHLGSGKQWDLSRKNGGLFVLPPYGTTGSKLYKSRFEAIGNAANFLLRSSEEYVVMSDCDTVCNLDFAPIIKEHINSKADITVVYRKAVIDEGIETDRTFFEVDSKNRVTRTINSKKIYGEQNLFTNILVVGRKFLLNILGDAELKGYKSFSKDILTKTKEFKIVGVPLDGYFAAIDCLSSYYTVSMELLQKENRDVLFYKNGNNIYTKLRDSAPLVTGEKAEISNSLIADGCIIEGEVKNSILFRGVKVEKGAKVHNSILFQDAFVGSRSTLNCVIADKQVSIGEKITLSGHETSPHFIGKRKALVGKG